MPALDPSEYTIDELEDELAEIDDPEELREVRDAEADGEDRTGARELIDERLDAVADDGASAGGDGSGEEGGENGASSRGGASIAAVREQLLEVAPGLLGRDLDAITGMQRDDDGWRATVEAVERRAVPDSQDILGRYEVLVDGSGGIAGYRRVGRHRRGDTESDR
ncbi:gas vesicle synthesis family protein [Halobacteriales archaeon QS_4_69_34]|nr:MAG: gas vesicle synthesis family protein [Halobacteriales archaeon QS_4_69_34]